jgi:hypothetical protein
MPHGLFCIPAAAAVAVAVNDDWQFAVFPAGIQRQVVTAHHLLALFVQLQHPWQEEVELNQLRTWRAGHALECAFEVHCGIATVC